VEHSSRGGVHRESFCGVPLVQGWTSPGEKELRREKASNPDYLRVEEPEKKKPYQEQKKKKSGQLPTPLGGYGILKEGELGIKGRP